MGSVGVFGPRWHNLGAALAIVGGALLLGFSTWPTPSSHSQMGDLTAAWAIALRIIAVRFVLSPFIVSRAPLAARGVLLVGSIVLAGVALLSAFATGEAAATVMFNIVPALFALTAAFTIGPRQRPEVARAKRAERAA